MGQIYKVIDLTKIRSQSKETIRKRTKTQSKPIIQLSSYETFIQEWASIKNASSSLGIDSGGISRACRGLQKKAGGFVWRYKVNNDYLTNNN